MSYNQARMLNIFPKITIARQKHRAENMIGNFLEHVRNAELILSKVLRFSGQSKVFI